MIQSKWSSFGHQRPKFEALKIGDTISLLLDPAGLTPHYRWVCQVAYYERKRLNRRFVITRRGDLATILRLM